MSTSSEPLAPSATSTERADDETAKTRLPAVVTRTSSPIELTDAFSPSMVTELGLDVPTDVGSFCACPARRASISSRASASLNFSSGLELAMIEASSREMSRARVTESCLLRRQNVGGRKTHSTRCSRIC